MRRKKSLPKKPKTTKSKALPKATLCFFIRVRRYPHRRYLVRRGLPLRFFTMFSMTFYKKTDAEASVFDFVFAYYIETRKNLKVKRTAITVTGMSFF